MTREVDLEERVMSDKKHFTHWGRNTYVSNCYWYHEYQDMQATVPTCEYYGKYGHCPCDTECEHFISRKEVSEMVRNLSRDSEIVRCKDCKWEIICRQTVEQANADEVEHRPLEWCSRGERREE